MSRIEELREKFRKKAQTTLDYLNSPQGQFDDALYAFVEKTFNASGMNREFADLMYARFAADEADDAETWLREATRGMFLSEFEPPRWVSEPAWCYHEGIPLVFMHQFTDENGDEFYVFRGKREVKGGFTPFYKMLSQGDNGDTILVGMITCPL